MHKYYSLQFFSNTCPYYLIEIFEFATHCRMAQEITFLNLKSLFIKQTWDKKQFLILVPVFGTACLTQLKALSDLNNT